MINSIQIQNYRGIKDMRVDNFKKYNIFTGDNGSCKTTILEALVGSGRNAVTLLIEMSDERGVKLNKKNINSFFYNTKINNNINIIINDSIKTEIYVNRQQDNIFDKNYLNANEDFLYGYIQKINNEIVTDIDIFIKEESQYGTIVKQAEGEIEKKVVIITPNNKISSVIALKIKEFIEKKRKNEILELLKKFDSNIDDVILDGKEIKVSLKEAEEFIPISSLGNGIAAILEIIISTLDDLEEIYIDEIETGIHYLNYPKLCRILIDILQEKSIQLFVTTHSKEFIAEFCYTLREKNEELSLYRFEKIKGNQLKQKYYSREEVLETIHEGWDVR